MEKARNKIVDTIILILIYAAATAVGVVCYVYIPIPAELFWARLLVADVIATVFVYIFSAAFRNASVYDQYWSVQPMVILIAFNISVRPSVAGVLLLAAVLVWGVRLTANCEYAFRDLSHEDWRYKGFRETTNKFLFPVINFCGFHLMPTLIVYACVLPAVYVTVYAPDYNAGSIVFFVLSLAAVALQATADIQMHLFRRRGGTGFIREGVWKHGRHPNYLAEVIMWWTVGLAAVCVMPSYWYLLAGAVLNTMLFLFISIPLADKHQSRKPGFEEYKKQTRPFI